MSRPSEVPTFNRPAAHAPPTNPESRTAGGGKPPPTKPRTRPPPPPDARNSVILAQLCYSGATLLPLLLCFSARNSVILARRGEIVRRVDGLEVNGAEIPQALLANDVPGAPPAPRRHARAARAGPGRIHPMPP